jgi:hypothetical protein
MPQPGSVAIILSHQHRHQLHRHCVVIILSQTARVDHDLCKTHLQIHVAPKKATERFSTPKVWIAIAGGRQSFPEMEIRSILCIQLAAEKAVTKQTIVRLLLRHPRTGKIAPDCLVEEVVGSGAVVYLQ